MVIKMDVENINSFQTELNGQIDEKLGILRKKGGGQPAS